MASNVQQMGKGLLRQAKQYTKGYSNTQIKVREATKNDPWGPSMGQLHDVASLTYNGADFIEVIETIDKRLNDKGKNWRHVYKSLIVVEYLLQAGSDNVVLYFKDNAYLIKTLKEFQYIDEDGKDQGANIRQKAKELTLLLIDDNRLRQLRGSSVGRRRRPYDDGYDDSPAIPQRPRDSDNDDMARAREASRRAAAEQRRLQDEDDANLKEAMRLSLEEEERRKKMLASQSNSIFDDFASKNQNDNSLIDLDSPAVLVPNFTYNPYAMQQQQQLQAQEEWERQQRLLAAQQQFEAQQQQQLQYQAWLNQQQQLMANQTGLTPQFTASYQSNNPFAPTASATSPPPLQPQPTSTQPLVPPRPPTPEPAPAPKPTRPTGDERHPELAQLLAGGPGVDTFGNTGDLRVPMGSAFASNKPNPFTR